MYTYIPGNVCYLCLFSMAYIMAYSICHVSYDT